MGECLKGIDKVLYLDCDVIVNGSLKDMEYGHKDNYALQRKSRLVLMITFMFIIGFAIPWQNKIGSDVD